MYNIKFSVICGHCAYGFIGMCAERKLFNDSSYVPQIVIGFPAVEAASGVRHENTTSYR
jgi:hypothetical protein